MDMLTPIRPVTMKAKRQSQVTASQITRGGAILAPTELPVLNQPVATERSLGGNQRVEVLTPDGMAAASLPPSRPRNRAIDCQLAREHELSTRLCALWDSSPS